MLWGRWTLLLGTSSRQLHAWALPSVCGGLEVELPVSIRTHSVDRYTLSLCSRGKDYQPDF